MAVGLAMRVAIEADGLKTGVTSMSHGVTSLCCVGHRCKSSIYMALRCTMAEKLAHFEVWDIMGHYGTFGNLDYRCH